MMKESDFEQCCEVSKPVPSVSKVVINEETGTVTLTVTNEKREISE